MNKENPFAEYGHVDKSPMELVEEFATALLLGHGIQVTEINFSGNGLDKFALAYAPKERVKTEPVGYNISRVHTSAGRINLGSAEEQK